MLTDEQLYDIVKRIPTHEWPDLIEFARPINPDTKNRLTGVWLLAVDGVVIKREKDDDDFDDTEGEEWKKGTDWQNSDEEIDCGTYDGNANFDVEEVMAVIPTDYAEYLFESHLQNELETFLGGLRLIRKVDGSYYIDDGVMPPKYHTSAPTKLEALVNLYIKLNEIDQ